MLLDKLIFLILFSTIIGKSEIGVDAFSCPSYSDEVKLKFGQVHEDFLYDERCPTVTGEDALLGSKLNMNCGVNGTLGPDGVASIYVIDTDAEFTNYIKKVCFNVHGVTNVTVEMFGELGDNTYKKDLSDSDTPWTRFCIETGDEFDVWAWNLYLEPKNDGSEVKVKNSKLTLCRFMVADFPDA